jgi:methionine aminotransferase
MHSKLPDVGTTIFTVMSRRAAELDAVNLGQGFPDYDIDPRLAELTARAMRAGHNQYAPMPGVPALQQRIGEQLQRRYGWQGEPGTGITVTLGATEALFSAILACVGPGDEAIIFDPAYDSYDPAIRLAGARCVHVPLQPPDFRYDWDRVRALVNDRTRLVIVNSPGNPSCAVLREGDLDELAAVLRGRDAVVISDEVYEHVLLPGTRHHGVLAHAELAPKSFAIFSFGKSLHATGVRVGYAVAPPALTTELRKVHQFNTFTIATPFQHAIAEYLAEKPAVFDGLAAFFAERRAVMLEALQGTGLRPLASTTCRRRCGWWRRAVSRASRSRLSTVRRRACRCCACASQSAMRRCSRPADACARSRACRRDADAAGRAGTVPASLGGRVRQSLGLRLVAGAARGQGRSRRAAGDVHHRFHDAAGRARGGARG